MKKSNFEALNKCKKLIMFSLFSITKKRESQLKKEQEVDNILETALNECPITLAQFLLARRKDNRKQFNEISDKNIFSQIEPISDNIDKLNIIYDLILSSQPNNICNILEKYK